ncbi:MAG TPA: hypothetical protein DEH03_10550 [Brevundimonas sp.]|nr:hypothetical protein [Brevundimonas sp.]
MARPAPASKRWPSLFYPPASLSDFVFLFGADGTIVLKFNDTHNRLAMMAVSVALLCIVAAAVIVPGRLGNLEALKEWGDILGGVLTIMAAGIAANYVVAQMRHAQSIEDDRLARARRAWLAMMPEAMSTVCDYAERSYRALLEQHAVAIRSTGLTSYNNPIEGPPTLDERIFPEIRAMIENAGDSAEADGYVELLSQIQVHRVRWRSRQHQLSTPDNNVLSATLETEMVYAAELYARASNLLGAARPRRTPEDLKPLSRARALYLLGSYRFPIEAVGTLAERWDKSRPLPAP